MRAYLYSFVVGCVVGVIYGAVRVKSPASPAFVLVVVLGMVAGEEGFSLSKGFMRCLTILGGITFRVLDATAPSLPLRSIEPFLSTIWLSTRRATERQRVARG